MLISLYQEYLYTIGKLKDIYKLEVDVVNKNIHIFYENKIPIFKLLFGSFAKNGQEAIVVSFHIDVKITHAIQWFSNIEQIHPDLKVADAYIEDDKGETYLGEDAEFIKNLKFQREVLDTWLSNRGEDEMREFVKSKIVGKPKNLNKIYDSRHDRELAIMEFELLKKPENGESN